MSEKSIWQQIVKPRETYIDGYGQQREVYEPQWISTARDLYNKIDRRMNPGKYVELTDPETGEVFHPNINDGAGIIEMISFPTPIPRYMLEEPRRVFTKITNRGVKILERPPKSIRNLPPNHPRIDDGGELIDELRSILPTHAANEETIKRGLKAGRDVTELQNSNKHIEQRVWEIVKLWPDVGWYLKHGGILKSQPGTKLLIPHKDYLGIPYKQNSDYNYFEAHPENVPSNSEKHWTSRNPITGKLLKSETHPTFDLMVKGEKEADMGVYRGLNGELYSYPKDKFVPLYLKHFNYGKR